MPPQPLLQALGQRPFAPFRLHVSDGVSYVIKHPDLLWLGPGYAIIGLPPSVPQAGLMIERHEVVDLEHITRLEPLVASSAGSN